MKLSRSLSALAFVLGACSKPEAPPPPPQAPAPVPAASAEPTNPAAAPGTEGGPATGGDPFSGEVKLADGVAADQIKPTDVLFLMARECGADCTKPGRLIAVQRHEKLTLPLSFKLGAENVMMPGTPFTGPFLVQARIDRDGDAMTKDANDLFAEVTTGVKPGQTGVTLAVAPPPGGVVPGVGVPPHAMPGGNPHGGMPGAAPNPHGGAMPGTPNPHGGAMPGGAPNPH